MRLWAAGRLSAAIAQPSAIANSTVPGSSARLEFEVIADDDRGASIRRRAAIDFRVPVATYGIAARLLLSLHLFARMQFFAENLAQRIFGQSVDELDVFGPFEACQPRAAELLQVAGVGLVSGFYHHVGLYRLAPFD
jgi:hypothetical protein